MKTPSYTPYLNTALFALAGLLILLFLPRNGGFDYRYEKGRPWMYETLTADFNFPILKTQEELRAEREKMAGAPVPCYSLQNQTEASRLKALSEDPRFRQLDAPAQHELLDLLSEAYTQGILAPESLSGLNPEGSLCIKQGKELREKPVTEVFSPQQAARHICHKLPNLPADSSRTFPSPEALQPYLVPNLLWDAATTEALQQQKIKDISPTKGVFYAGQQIVAQGEIVTAEVAQLLDSIKAEYDTHIGFTGHRGYRVLGQALVVLLALFLIYVIMKTDHSPLLSHTPKVLYILFILTLMATVTALTYQWNSHFVILIPMPVFALFLATFFPPSLSSLLYLAFMLPLSIIIRDDTRFLVSGMFAGPVAVYAFRYYSRGWKQFILVCIVAACYAFIHIADYLIGNGSLRGMVWHDLQYYVLTALFIVAAYPLTLLFEKVFGFVSRSRLRDLIDTSNPLLKKLSATAPGTMQHSLQVANLADSAAHAIGANHLLCRAGALYHDIGKINNPQYFTENVPAGYDPHQTLSPKESAQTVIRHVEDGLALAHKHALPGIIASFIETHHGTSRPEYFYTQYVNAGGDPHDTAAFTYPGRLPTTREEVIVSLADAVEAAARSLKNYEYEYVTALVDNIVKAKFDTRQLDNSDITLKEIQTVKQVFKTRIIEMYHTRIAYPKKAEAPQ